VAAAAVSAEAGKHAIENANKDPVAEWRPVLFLGGPPMVLDSRSDVNEANPELYP